MRKSLFEERSIAVRMLEVRFWTRKGVAREAQVPPPIEESEKRYQESGGRRNIEQS